MTLHPALVNARGIRGERCFYPPGQHPATYQLRCCNLDALLRFRETVRGRAVDEATLQVSINYAEGQLAAFEEQHSEAKADFLRLFL